ncbi:DEAD/DEAH box helicase [Bradyrhizobium oligotrophicum S58]
MTVILRPNQIAAADAVEDGFRAGLRCPLVASCVGSGKSLGMAEIARRNWARGERTIIAAHTRELVEQNAAACRALGLQVGINAEALGERVWRAPVISASIQSVYNTAQSFGLVPNLAIDECDLVPHSESGMYRALDRGLGFPRLSGWTGTDFRLNGGKLTEGEGALFQKVVYRYDIVDGIRDGYLVPAFSAAADDKMDVAKLRRRQGEYTGDSQDAQMIEAMDNHIVQMLHHGHNRRSWLVFEASTKAARAMADRMNQWGIPTGLVLGTTPGGERAQLVEAFRAGRLRALINVNALCVGFDVQQVDMLVMRRRTKSLRLYIQMIGRLLRAIGGTIEKSIAAGKADGLVLDFAGNIDEHGAIDLIFPKESKASLQSCENCGKRNASAAARCWSCDAPMTRLCPANPDECPPFAKGSSECPTCGHNISAANQGGEPRKAAALLDTPSGAALISTYRPAPQRAGGWLPIRKVWQDSGVYTALTAAGERMLLPEALAGIAGEARWIRGDGSVLVPNGANRTSVRQYGPSGSMLLIPMPIVEQENGNGRTFESPASGS